MHQPLCACCGYRVVALFAAGKLVFLAPHLRPICAPSAMEGMQALHVRYYLSYCRMRVQERHSTLILMTVCTDKHITIGHTQLSKKVKATTSISG